MDIFSNQPGYVAVLDAGLLPPVRFTLDGFTSEWFNTVVTSIAFECEAGFQATHTLSDFLYLYSFGRRVGPMTIQGVAFPQLCSADSSDSFGSQPHGVESVYDYFNQNNVVDCEDPLTVVIGQTAFTFFLNKTALGITDPASGLGTFALMGIVLPELPTTPTFSTG